MIRAIFFDAIDTLFRPYPDKIGTYVRITKEACGVEYSREQMSAAWDKIVGETEAEAKAASNQLGHAKMAWTNFNANLLRELGYTGDCEKIGQALQHESWDNPNNYQLYPDVLPSLKLLSENNIYIACVSNEDGMLHKFFDHFEIKSYFNFILTSMEVGVEKPNPKMFLAALSKTDFKPEEVLFVGDSVISDYRGAEAVGMQPLLIDRDLKNTDNSVVSINDLTKITEYL